MATLSSVTQTKFVEMVWPGLLEKLKQVDKRWGARDLLEASSATTQCQNTVGPCNPGVCHCWICGEPVYLNDNGEEVRKASEIDEKLVPNCEHKLPIIQAFLILGGLYWAKQPPEKESIIRENYAWSHAVCNIQKSDHIYFDDDGIKLGEIRTLLNTLWDHASFKPIQKRLRNDGLTKDAWIRRQTGSMTQQIQPLYDYYKKGNSDGNYGLNLLSGVSIPLSYYNDLVATLPHDSRLRIALLEYRPEHIQKLEINKVLQSEGERERKMYIDPSQIAEAENACNDSKISEKFRSFIPPGLARMRLSTAERSPQYKDKLKFLLDLLQISSGIENKCDSTFQGAYWQTQEITIPLSYIEENIGKFQCGFFNKVLPPSGIADIIRDINLFLPNSLQKKAYLLEIVQTIFLFFLIDSSLNFRPGEKFMPDVLREIKGFTEKLILLLASQLRILYTKEIYSSDQDERYFTSYILNKYTGNTFIEKIKGMLHAFPDMLESIKDIDQLIGKNIPPPTWDPNEIPQNIAKVLMDMGKNTDTKMSQAPAGAGDRPSSRGGKKKRTKRKGKRKKNKKTRKRRKKTK
jgi:hypothetical protein